MLPPCEGHEYLDYGVSESIEEEEVFKILNSLGISSSPILNKKKIDALSSSSSKGDDANENFEKISLKDGQVNGQVNLNISTFVSSSPLDGGLDDDPDVGFQSIKVPNPSRRKELNSETVENLRFVFANLFQGMPLSEAKTRSIFANRLVFNTSCILQIQSNGERIFLTQGGSGSCNATTRKILNIEVKNISNVRRFNSSFDATLVLSKVSSMSQKSTSASKSSSRSSVKYSDDERKFQIVLSPNTELGKATVRTFTASSKSERDSIVMCLECLTDSRVSWTQDAQNQSFQEYLWGFLLYTRYSLKSPRVRAIRRDSFWLSGFRMKSLNKNHGYLQFSDVRSLLKQLGFQNVHCIPDFVINKYSSEMLDCISVSEFVPFALSLKGSDPLLLRFREYFPSLQNSFDYISTNELIVFFNSFQKEEQSQESVACICHDYFGFVFQSEESLLNHAMSESRRSNNGHYNNDTNNSSLERGVDFTGFCDYLFSNENCILKQDSQVRKGSVVDLFLPLSSYLCNSFRHGERSLSIVRSSKNLDDLNKALHSGVRCFEVGVWNHSNHGIGVNPKAYDPHSFISLESFANMVKNSGFINSDYPIILCLEINCNELSEEVMISKILNSVMGSLIVKPKPLSRHADQLIQSPLDRFETLDQLPTLSSLAGKIILVSEVGTKIKTCALASLVLLRAELYRPSNSVFGKKLRDYVHQPANVVLKITHIDQIDDVDALKEFTGNHLVWFAQSTLFQSNAGLEQLFKAASYGIQLIPRSYFSQAGYLMLKDYFDQVNRGIGYVPNNLKPTLKKRIFEVEVLSGRYFYHTRSQLQAEPSNFTLEFVCQSIWCSECSVINVNQEQTDINNKLAITGERNSTVPVWNETFRIQTVDIDSTYLSVTLISRLGSNSTRLACRVLKLDKLREGIRSLDFGREIADSDVCFGQVLLNFKEIFDNSGDEQVNLM